MGESVEVILRNTGSWYMILEVKIDDVVGKPLRGAGCLLKVFSQARLFQSHSQHFKILCLSIDQTYPGIAL